MVFYRAKFLSVSLVVIWGLVCTAKVAAESATPTRVPVGNPLERFQECGDCPEMIVMPTGSFMMGAIPGESRNRFTFYGKDGYIGVRGPDEVNISPSEHPRHRVEMDIPYAIGRNEITHAEWMACVDDGGCSHVPEHSVLTLYGQKNLGPSHPVINVSYLDSLEYTAWLNTLVGADVYRLPTEAEWKYAARAGTETRFAQGDDLTAEQANFSRRATERLRGRGVSLPALKNRRIPVPVEDLDAENAWGVRHMSGNVSELTSPCWTDEHVGLSKASAYLALSEQQRSCERIVAKGGAFTTAMDGLRPARRVRPTQYKRRSSRGFRVVRIFEAEK